jgi:hypothetical protein
MRPPVEDLRQHQVVTSLRARRGLRGTLLSELPVVLVVVIAAALIVSRAVG